MGYNTTAWTTDGQTQTTGGATLYAYFGINYQDFSNIAANSHYLIPFSSVSGGASATNIIDIGTDANPDTTFTTANTNTQYASQLVPMLWYVPDNITIDAVYAIEGADTSTGETTRMHLMKYNYTSNSTSTLLAGAVVASNDDVSNDGNEQTYLSEFTLTVGNANVKAGQVVVATFRADSTVNSDYSLNIIAKYHLT